MPRLRVSPLNPQVAFALRPGDPVFRPPEAGGFVRLCLPDPLPVLKHPFRVSTGASRPLGEVVSPDTSQRAGPRSNRDLTVPGFTSSAETTRPWKCNSEGDWFLMQERFLRPPSATFPIRMLRQVRPRLRERVKYAPRNPPKRSAGGARLPAVPGLYVVADAIPEVTPRPNLKINSRFTPVLSKNRR